MELSASRNTNTYARLLNVSLRMSVLILKFLFVFFAAKFWSPEQLGQYGLIATAIAYCGYLVGLDFYVNTQRNFLDVSPNLRNETITHHFFLIAAAFCLLVPCLVMYFEAQFSFDTLIFLCCLIFFEQANAEVSRLLVLKNKQLLVSSLFLTKFILISSDRQYRSSFLVNISLEE